MIKKCTEKDLSLLKTISIDTFKETFSNDNSKEDMELYLKEAYNSTKLLKELRSKESSFYFIYVEDKLAGYLKLNIGEEKTENKTENSLEIERIYILNDYKRQGLGNQLIELAILEAKRNANDYIWLGVWEKNYSALSFYQKNGFEKSGSHEFKLGDDIQTDLIMKKVI